MRLGESILPHLDVYEVSMDIHVLQKEKKLRPTPNVQMENIPKVDEEIFKKKIPTFFLN